MEKVQKCCSMWFVLYVNSSPINSAAEKVAEKTGVKKKLGEWLLERSDIYYHGSRVERASIDRTRLERMMLVKNGRSVGRSNGLTGRTLSQVTFRTQTLPIRSDLIVFVRIFLVIWWWHVDHRSSHHEPLFCVASNVYYDQSLKSIAITSNT